VAGRRRRRPRRRQGRKKPTAIGSGDGGVKLTKLGDFDQPLYVTQPGGDTSDLFVVERTGAIRVIHNGTVQPQPFLDVSGRITSAGTEQGLLSMAFAPDYAKSGRFYVDYTDTNGDTRVVEYRRSAGNPLRADPGSAREVLGVKQPFENHNGGLVLFGPDGDLYIGLGDGGSEGDPQRNGQNLGTLLGKILRIDPRPQGGKPYGIPKWQPVRGARRRPSGDLRIRAAQPVALLLRPRQRRRADRRRRAGQLRGGRLPSPRAPGRRQPRLVGL